MSRLIRQTALRFIVLSLIVVTAGACDRFASGADRLDRAEKQAASGNFSAALGDLKTLVESEPKNPRVRVLLARIALHMGDAEGAQKELDRAIEAGADPAATRLMQLQVLLAKARYDEVLKRVVELSAAATSTELAVAAKAHLGLGQGAEALAAARRARALDDAAIDARLAEVEALAATGEREQAKRTIDAALEQDRDNSAALLLKGRLAMADGDVTAALDALRAARGKAGAELTRPRQVELRALLVDAHLANRDLAGAREELSELQARAPGTVLAHLYAGRVALAAKDLPTAVAELQKAAASNPELGQVRLLLAAALLERGSKEQAEAELTRLVAAEPSNMEATRLLAKIYLDRNDKEAARRLVSSSDAIPTDPAQLQFATSVLVATGGMDAAISMLETAFEKNPDSAEIRLALAQAYLQSGRPSSAREILKPVDPAAGGLRLRQLQLAGEVFGKPPAEARKHILAIVEEQPRDVDLLQLGAGLLFRLGDLDAAEQLYGRAVSLDAGRVEARFALASIAELRGDAAAVASQLDAVLNRDPSNLRALVASAFAARKRGDYAAAEAKLERAITAEPAAPLPRLLLADMAFARKDDKKATALVNQAVAASQTKPAALHQAGQLLLQHARFEEALAKFDEASRLGSEVSDLGSAASLVGLQRGSEARARLEAVTAKRPGWLDAVGALVKLDAASRQFEPALRRIDAYEKAGGDRDVADQLRAGLLAERGDLAGAIRALERASRSRLTAPVAARLISLKSRTGEPGPEKSTVAWLSDNPNDTAVRLVLAEYYLGRGNRTEAIAQYEKVLQLRQDLVALNNLAWLYDQQGNSRALELARRAYAMAPQDARVQDTYGWLLLRKGSIDEAAGLLAKAAAAQPSDLEIQYHHAASLARIDRRAESTRVLKTILADATAFPARQEAEALLRDLSRSD